MKNFLNLLQINKIKFAINETLKKYNTWRIGGEAEVVVFPDNFEKLSLIINFLNKNKMQYFVLGKGSNLLIPDKGFKGVIIKLVDGFDHFNIHNNIITVGSGFSFIRLSLLAAKNGLSGLEFAGGIPGTVGGAVTMNAGAHGSDVSKILKRVLVMDTLGNVFYLQNKELSFSYRNSIILKKKYIVLEAEFNLEVGDKQEIAKTTSSFKAKRILTQPYNLPSCGSVFKNPLPSFAGELIEKAGLKGYKIGDAMFSDLHANFIVNLGNAKSDDIIALIELAKMTVKEKFNVDLQTEVKFLGEV